MTAMASRGDFNLNLMPAREYEEHLKEGLKYAMVQHEIIFKHQVRELHRLYWTQKRLMNEVIWRQTVFTSVHEEVPAVDSIEFASDSADEIVNASTEETRSDICQYALAAGHVKVNFSSTEAKVNKASDLKAVEDTDKKKAHPKATASDIPSMEIRMPNESGHSPLEKYAHSENLVEKWRNNKFIDSDTGLEHGGSQSVNSPTEKQKSKYKHTFIDLNIAQDYEFVNSSPSTVEASTSPSTRSTIVLNGADLSVSNIYSKGSTSTVQPGFVSPDLRNSRERIPGSLHHDLNISFRSSAQTSVQSSNAIDHINYKGVDNEFLTPSIRNSKECCKNLVESIPNANKMGTQHSSDGPIPEELHKHGKGCTFSLLDQPIISDGRNMIPVSCSYLENNCLHAPAESTNLPPNTGGGLEEKMSRKEESEEDTLSSHAKVAHGEKQDEPEPPSVTKINHFECTSENGSVTNNVVVTNSEYSATELDIPSNKAQTFEDCEVPFNIEERACHFYRSQSEVYLDQKLAQVISNDHIVATAAKTLLSISLMNQYAMDHLIGDRKTESESEESKDQPQSSDSFETITLKQKEIRDYGSLVCNKQIDKDGRKVMSGCKLRRGLRDFQKDILPGIISLSRHEICEDLYAIKYELRKNPSSRNSEETCLLPTRSRRSKPYNIGRRC